MVTVASGGAVRNGGRKLSFSVPQVIVSRPIEFGSPHINKVGSLYSSYPSFQRICCIWAQSLLVISLRDVDSDLLMQHAEINKSFRAVECEILRLPYWETQINLHLSKLLSDTDNRILVAGGIEVCLRTRLFEAA